MLNQKQIQAEIDRLQPLTREGDPIARRVAFAMICALNEVVVDKRKRRGVVTLVESAKVNAHLCRVELGEVRT